MSRPARTFKKRKAFLDQLAVGNSVSYAAHAAGGTTGFFRKWRREDPDFAQDWEDAIEEGTDFIEDVALDRALKKSDPLMQMMLKARRPEKYDRASKLELSGGIDVTGSKAKLLNRIARIQAEGDVPESGDQEKQQIPEDKSKEIPALPPPSNEGSDQDRPSAVRGSKRRQAVGGG